MTDEAAAIRLMRERVEIGVPVPTDIAATALLEFDRLRSIEQRAVEVATHPEGVATRSLAARGRTRRHVACHILGWSESP